MTSKAFKRRQREKAFRLAEGYSMGTDRFEATYGWREVRGWNVSTVDPVFAARIDCRAALYRQGKNPDVWA